MHSKLRHTLLCHVVSAGTLLPAVVWAQPQDEPVKKASTPATDVQIEEVIVTGTLIRGTEAPVGTSVVELSRAAVEQTGAITTAQLLQSIPQFGAFNGLSFAGGSGNTVTTNRPNLRQLPGFNNSGGSTTLVLVDGHRIVGAGVTSTSPDPDIVPPGMIERVEILPDGGSAIYGSDAVAGVINFITRKKFDGLQVSGRYGVGDDYSQWNTTTSAGTSWESGGAYVSYNYSEHQSILGRDRDYVHEYPFQSIGGLPLISLTCSPGNVQQGTRVFALPFNTTTGAPIAGTANQCDSSDYATVYPREDRHSVLASVSQAFGSAVELDTKAFFTKRQVDFNRGPYTFTQPVSNATQSPYFASHNVGNSQNVSGAFGPNDALAQAVDLETWGVTPSLQVDLSQSWQLRLTGSYGRSTTTSHDAAVNTAAMNTARNLGLFNPYDPMASDPAALAAISDYEVYGRTKQRLYDIRAVADGSLFHLPGGDLKVAVGAEYYDEHFQTSKGETVPGYQSTGFPGLSVGNSIVVAPIAAVPSADLHRSAKAAFTEIMVPIVGEPNAVTGIRELSVSAAGRYDEYSDFGDTFNPRFGLTYKPIEWVNLRGSWGESFVAPSLADFKQADLTQLIFVPASAFAPPADTVANGTYPAVSAGQFVLGIRGNSPGIKPQTAKTLSVGFDVQPPIVPGLNIAMTYYRIDFKGVIGLPPAGGTATADLYRNYGFLVQAAPTQQQIDATVAAADIPPTLCTPLPTCVYAILDVRKRNLGNFKLSGIDTSTSYDIPVSFGLLSFGVAGTYELNRKQSAAPSLPYVGQLGANRTRFRLRTYAGAQVGNLAAQLAWNHTKGFDIDPAAGLVAPLQTKVEDFDVFNLFVRYDVNRQGMLSGLALTLNVDNLFDTDPPKYVGVTSQTNARGFLNGNTLGRVFQLGIDKKF